MVERTLAAIGRVTKKAFVGALKGTGEKAQAIVETTADPVKVTIVGVGNFMVLGAPLWFSTLWKVKGVLDSMPKQGLMRIL
jgi:hypothetical protein